MFPTFTFFLKKKKRMIKIFLDKITHTDMLLEFKRLNLLINVII